jgi:hypothetical protein
MATDHIVALLVAERDRLTRAIDALQGPAKRRGRPAGSTSKVAKAVHTSEASHAKAAAPARKRRNLSPAARKAASERMKAYWAAKRKQKAKS